MNIDQSIFKAYDIRGTVPDQINPEVAEQIGRAYAKWLMDRRQRTEDRKNLQSDQSNVKCQMSNVKVVVGQDVRTHSLKIAQALIRGLTSQSIDVVDVGIISTPMLAFITGSAEVSGGICVTASHNDKEYNGFKMVREKAIPISGDSGIMEIRQIAKDKIPDQPQKGQVSEDDFFIRYLDHIQKIVDFKTLKSKKIVFNPNFGAICIFMDELSKLTPAQYIKLNAEADGNFPKGKPDPMIETNRRETSELIKSSQADFGVSFDADGDRVYFFDENGQFIDPYYLGAIFSKAILNTYPRAKIVHDPRSFWATVDTIEKNGGQALINKAGNMFFKERMRVENAVFALENSGHYFFRDDYFADDGLLAFLCFWQFYSSKNCPFSELFKEIQTNYKISGEINFNVQSTDQVIAVLKSQYNDGQQDEIDGLSVEYLNWRFNIRPSNTEPVIRLNAESRSQAVIDKNLPKLIAIIESLGGKVKK